MWLVDASSGSILACRGYADDEPPSKEAPATLKFVEIFANDADLSARRLLPRVYCREGGLWQGEAFTLATVGKL